MIVRKYFNSDIIDWVKDIQCDLYNSLIYYIYEAARKKYIESENILDVKTELGEFLQERQIFNHRKIEYCMT